MALRLTSLGIASALLFGACGGAPGSTGPSPLPSPSPVAALASPSPSPIPTPTAAAPTPSATPPVPAVLQVVPPNTETPEAAGTLGLDWGQANKATGHGTGIVHGPAGWLYVAGVDGESPSVPRLRSSSDLRTWTERRPDDPDLIGGVDWTLAGSDAAYVLAGNGLWQSVDGRHWEPGVAAQGGSGRIDVDHVLADSGAFVAWKAFSAADGIWMSADGRAWSKVALPDAPAVIIDAVAALPSGGFVVAGRAGTDAAGLDAVEGPARRWEARPGTQAVWTSGGRMARSTAPLDAWSSVPLGTGFETARITGIAAGGPGGGIVAIGNPGVVAEGSNIEPEIAVWRWLEGTGWQRLLGQGFPTVQRDPGDVRVLATAPRWLLVGSRMRADARNVLDLTVPGVVAGSDDGTSWWSTAPIVLGPDPNYVIDAVAAVPGRLAFLTNGGTSIAGTVRVWVSPSD